MKNKIDSSRQKTPWDNNENTTALQQFLIDKYKENYRTKHPKLSDTNEATIINSIDINNCKLCASENIIKKGKTKNNIQMYLCKSCGKRFTPTLNTIFENHKIPITEWIEFLLELFNYGSTSLISKSNKNAINTSIYWIHKVFLVLDHYQDNMLLKGNVYIDEMFYKVMKKDIQTKNGKQPRGLSCNQLCIGVGYDGTNIIAIFQGFGKTSTKKTNDTFLSHIQTNSKLIHDDEKSHHDLIEKLKLIDENYSSEWLKTKDDKENPLRPINHQIDLIKQFLNAHSGFNRDDLQGYLNLYCFMHSGNRNKLELVEEFIKIAMNTNAKLSYRDIFESNS